MASCRLVQVVEVVSCRLVLVVEVASCRLELVVEVASYRLAQVEARPLEGKEGRPLVGEEVMAYTMGDLWEMVATRATAAVLVAAGAYSMDRRRLKCKSQVKILVSQEGQSCACHRFSTSILSSIPPDRLKQDTVWLTRCEAVHNILPSNHHLLQAPEREKPRTSLLCQALQLLLF